MKIGEFKWRTKTSKEFYFDLESAFNIDKIDMDIKFSND